MFEPFREMSKFKASRDEGSHARDMPPRIAKHPEPRPIGGLVSESITDPKRKGRVFTIIENLLET